MSIVYLFVCNRPTRQSLHDLVVGSYVGRVDAEAAAKPRICSGHLAVVGLILLVMAAPPFTLQGAMQKGTLAEIMPAYEAVTAQPEVTAAQVVAGTNYFWDNKNSKQTTTSVSAVVSVNRPIEDNQAGKIAELILQAYPAAAEKDAMKVPIARPDAIAGLRDLGQLGEILALRRYQAAFKSAPGCKRPG